MTDVFMTLDENGGDIVVISNERSGGPWSGEIQMTDGPETDFILTLFGGQSAPEWWGNLVGDVSYKSETQKVLDNMPITSSNLVLLEKAVIKDLKSAKIVKYETLTISIPKPNRVSIEIDDIKIERPWL